MKKRTLLPRPHAIAPQLMRRYQYAMQERDYKNLTVFSGYDSVYRKSAQAAPVAVFMDNANTPTPLFLRDLKRLYRLAKADAKREAQLMRTPGPASAFVEIAKRPYERLMQQTHPKAKPAP